MEPNSSRGTAREKATGASSEDWKQLLPAGALLLAVLGILLLGGLLQTEPEPTQGGSPAATVRIEHPLQDEKDRELSALPNVETPGPGSSPPAADTSAAALAVDPIAERALRDAGRLAGGSQGWTLQLLVACDPENARRLLRLAGGSQKLYLLPLMIDGRSCFRICWGRYSDRESALGPGNLPSSIREAVEKPLPKPISDVLP